MKSWEHLKVKNVRKKIYNSLQEGDFYLEMTLMKRVLSHGSVVPDELNTEFEEKELRG